MPEDVANWPDWIQRHGAMALLYALQLTGTRADAEDAVHDGFIRFWGRRHAAQNMPALFFASVRTAALDLRRGEARRRRRDRGRLPEMPQLAGAGESGEMREQIERALGELPEAQREVVVMKIWGDLTFAQIAEVVVESPNTVATRYRYAMAKLEQMLSPEYEHGK